VRSRSELLGPVIGMNSAHTYPAVIL
jgi:hypothetical protein